MRKDSAWSLAHRGYSASVSSLPSFPFPHPNGVLFTSSFLPYIFMTAWPLKQDCLGLHLSCVTLGKSLTHSEPQFPPLCNGDNKSAQSAIVRIR